MLENAKLLLAALVAAAPVGLAQAGQMDVENELRELKAQVAELRAQSADSWMTKRRAEEVKALIGEVIADADTRASMAGDGMTAGWNKNFFLASEDGNFVLKLEGQVQARYIWNNIDDDSSSTDDNLAGFQQRRTKLGFKGHIYDPRLEYKIKAGFERDGGSFVLEEGYGKYNYDNGMYAKVGQFKGRFLREELV
ncbi:MAG: hypothetical protein ACYTGQ_16220, partial [Planctomycetota bacterium]